MSNEIVVYETTNSGNYGIVAVSYTHLRAHETVLDLVCRLLLEKKNKMKKQNEKHNIVQQLLGTKDVNTNVVPI